MGEKKLIVTGGAGFIGSALIRFIINNTEFSVCNIDKLTYAGNLESLPGLEENDRYNFQQVDICNKDEIKRIITDFNPNAIVHLAAESHVDRSIDGPAEFINTNILGTYNLLENSREYYESLDKKEKESFRFLHVSTDEVFGSLGKEGFFSEDTKYEPNSPYSASKASSDHLVRAWKHTFGLPALITNCSNNYGPYQYPEKLIPVVVLSALKRNSIPVYGKGENIRDWLYVEDHVKAIMKVLENGRIGETYNVGGRNEKSNIEIVRMICSIMDDLLEKPKTSKHESLIEFVEDRPGHDLRYAIDPTKIENEIKWKQEMPFEKGLRTTVKWYINNLDWCEAVLKNKYNLERLGVVKK